MTKQLQILLDDDDAIGAHHYIKKNNWVELKNELQKILTLMMEKSFISVSRNKFVLQMEAL